MLCNVSLMLFTYTQHTPEKIYYYYILLAQKVTTVLLWCHRSNEFFRFSHYFIDKRMPSLHLKPAYNSRAKYFMLKSFFPLPTYKINIKNTENFCEIFQYLYIMFFFLHSFVYQQGSWRFQRNINRKLTLIYIVIRGITILQYFPVHLTKFS